MVDLQDQHNRYPLSAARCFRLLVILMLSLAASAQDERGQREDAGFISEVKGSCWLQRGSARVPITLSKYGGATLRVGDKVRCDEDGSLVLELKSLRTTIEPSPSDQWTTIPRPAGPRKDAMAGPVDDWFTLAGGLRGLSRGVYSPPSGGYGSAVWPEHFVIRWVPRKAPGSLSLSIRDESRIRLWPQSSECQSVRADLGELDSDEVRQVLLMYRQSGRRPPLTLVLVNSDGNEDDVPFSIISLKEAETLAGQLETCDQQSGLMHHICRSYYFRQVDLYTEAAEEYEEALKLAPDSIDLQVHLIAANQLTGNYARAQELIGKLPRGTELP
jgi:hypothetical protein